MDCRAQPDNETDIFSFTEHFWSSIRTRVPKSTLLWNDYSRDKWRLGRRWKLSVASHLLSLVLKFPLMCESLKHSLPMQRYLWKLCNLQEKAWGAKLSWVLHCCLGWEIFGHGDAGIHLGSSFAESPGLHLPCSRASQDMEHFEAGEAS